MRNKKWISLLLCTLVCGAYGCNDDSNGRSSDSESGTCNCNGDQVCENGTCVDKKIPDPGECTDPNGCENPDPECTDPNGCPLDKPDDTCSETCTAPDYCEEGVCRTCTNPCDQACCSENQVCDTLDMVCVDKCEDGREPCSGSCCAENQICGFYGCQEEVVCTDNQTLCPDPEYAGMANCCDNEKEECDKATGQCVEVCKSGIVCGGVCCDEGLECDATENKCLPPCAGTRCGANDDLCCDSAAQICQYEKCLPKGTSCTKGDDCDFDEYCELTSNTCVANENNPNVCEVKPEAGPFEPVVKWWWPKDLPGGVPSVHPEFDQVMNIPSIINLTDDDGDGKINEYDVPDLVFTTFSKTLEGYHYTGLNVLRAISGKDGSELATHPEYFPLAHDPGIAKVNNDEYPEIVLGTTIGEQGYTVILNLIPKSDGTGYEFKEVAKLEGMSVFARFANMDGGEFPQIITSAGIIEYVEKDGVGTYQWRCKGDFGDGHVGSTVADLDGDGEMEIVGQKIFNKKCEVISDDSISQTGTVLADLDRTDDHANGRLDVEQIAITYGGYGTAAEGAVPPKGKVHAFKVFKNAEGKFHREQIWETEMPIDYEYAQTFLGGRYYADGTPFRCDKICDTDADAEGFRRYMCATGGGPLVVADFDNDNKPDIGLATTWSYAVYNSEGKIIWADFHTQDYSSRATGSSLFDFEGDGVAEVLYADEINLHVYKGRCMGPKDEKFPEYCAATKLIPDIPNSSGTLIEYPQVVDVNNDGRSEIVVTSNDYAFLADQHITGIRAFGDPNDRWVRTRRIWNQYDYHVTNINEDGTVPKHEKQNWKVKNLNNFRQNIQPGGLFNAPNLVAVALEGDQSQCSDILILTATVENKGSLGIPAGASVKFYVEDVNGTGKTGYIGETKLSKALLPGTSAKASLKWDMTVTLDGKVVKLVKTAKIYFVIDEPTTENPKGEYIECDKSDNKSAVAEIELCPEKFN